MPLALYFLQRPPDLVGGLIAALGVPLSTLYKAGDPPLMGWAPAPAPPSPTPPPPLTADVATVAIRFPWDIHHERPIESAATVASKPIIEYFIHFTRGRKQVEATLLETYGEPQAMHGRRRYGLFFVDAEDTDHFTLEWYAEEPDWAKAPVDPQQRIEDVRRFVVAGEPGTLEMSPPMPAGDYAAALGIVDPEAITTDVHMTMWRMEYIVGDHTVRAQLDGWPSGEQLPGYGRRRVGAEDPIRSIELE